MQSLGQEQMTPLERRASLSLAAIFGLRMLGLFIILPVFALYAVTLPGGQDKTLVGIALGAYGLTQAILQIPFGWWSDRYGRKPVIYAGLVLFAIGSFIAAGAHDIYWVIIGRAIQGAGAISAAVIALTADLTRDAVRAKAMALIGITIGASFALSLVAAPALASAIGVPGIFALTGALALLAMLAVRTVVPAAPLQSRPANASGTEVFRSVLRHPQLARLNLGIFSLHAVLMALFLVVPFSLSQLGIEARQHWVVYLPVMLASFVLMTPGIIASGRGDRTKRVFVGAVVTLTIALAMLGAGRESLPGVITGMIVFFTAFNVLEALLPALVSRYAPPHAKGAAIGVYSTVQFLGTFVGAALAGWLLQHFSGVAVYVFCALLTIAWLIAALSMQAPQALQVLSYPLQRMPEAEATRLSERLRRVRGVMEAAVSVADCKATLKVEKSLFDEAGALRLIEQR